MKSSNNLFSQALKLTGKNRKTKYRPVNTTHAHNTMHLKALENIGSSLLRQTKTLAD